MRLNFNEIRGRGFASHNMKVRDDRFKEIKNFKSVHKCPICGTNVNYDNKILKYEFVSLIKCDTCKCAYNDLIPNDPTSSRYNLKTSEKLKDIHYEQTKKYRMATMLKERVQYISEYINKDLSDCTLLDVGCNTGLFLQYTKSLFKDSCGVELYDVLAKVATDRSKCKIYNGDFLHLDSMTQKYDIITMFDFIEHIPNPIECLIKAKTLLKDDGIIVIFTPNYVSFSFNVLKEHNNLVDPADHLLFFSISTFKYIEENLVGSYVPKIKRIETIGIDFYDIMAYIRDIGMMSIDDLLEHDDDIWEAQYELDKTYHSNHMRVILE